MKNDLASWLDEELETRGWSIREMARRAGVSHTAIASALNRKGRPSADLCVAIADALGVPAVEIVQRAGILPPDPPETAAWRRLNEMWARLPDADQERILEIVETWVQKRGRQARRVPSPAQNG
jgi:transcriptional regulator with XRE-family HTH domain